MNNSIIIYKGKQYDKSKVKTNRTIFQIIGGVLFIAAICCFFAIAIGAFLFTLLASWACVFIAYRYEKILKSEKPINKPITPVPVRNVPIPVPPVPQPVMAAPAATSNIPVSAFGQKATEIKPAEPLPDESQTHHHTNVPDYDEEYSFKASGTSFKEDNILLLLCENDLFTMSKDELIEYAMTDEPIYKYDTIAQSAELIQEPENEYDPNAIAIYTDNVHIGYVPSKKYAKVKKLLDSGSVVFVLVEITGGPCKIIKMNDEGNYSSSTRNHSFSVNVTLCIKNQ